MRHRGEVRPVVYAVPIMVGLLLGSPPAEAQQQQDAAARASQSREIAAAATVPTKVPPFMRTGLRPADSERIAFRTAAFVMRSSTADVLTRIWEESVAAGQERVGCLDGYIEDGVFHITRAMLVPTKMADSLQVSPGPSLARCGPPEWRGTVHTHIALFNGRRFATLSPSDRHVNALWRGKWDAEGIFCVLYSESGAYCEYGHSHAGDVPYSDEQPEARPLFRPRG